MHPLMTEELAEQRRQDLLHQAERERCRARARSAHPAAAARGSSPRSWRAAAGVALVRIGVRLGGGSLADSMIVVPERGVRPAMMAVVWRGHDGDPRRSTGTGRRKGRRSLRPSVR